MSSALRLGPALRGKTTSDDVQSLTYCGFCLLVRDRSLITGRGGELQNGKTAVPKLVWTPLKPG